jgi:hypothetical protein
MVFSPHPMVFSPPTISFTSISFFIQLSLSQASLPSREREPLPFILLTSSPSSPHLLFRVLNQYLSAEASE